MSYDIYYFGYQISLKMLQTMQYTPCSSRTGYTIPVWITIELFIGFIQNLACLNLGLFLLCVQNYMTFWHMVPEIFIFQKDTPSVEVTTPSVEVTTPSVEVTKQENNNYHAWRY